MRETTSSPDAASDLVDSIDRLAAETRFSGVVRVDQGGRVVLASAFGLAHRGYGVANAVDGRFGIASGTKGLTALTVVSLIEEGRLELATPARAVLGDDLPLVGDDVTIDPRWPRGKGSAGRTLRLLQ